jgi:two-component system, NarL family, nitrate/nitrite response regulator NarL
LLRRLPSAHGRGRLRPARAVVTRVLVLGDIRLFREGLELILEARPETDPVGTASRVDEAVSAFHELRPDVVLVDGAMRDAVEAVGAAVAAEPGMRIVVLGIEERETEVIAYAEAGVSGYVMRDADTDTLCRTLETAAAGGALCSPHVAAALLRRVAALHAQLPEPKRASRLTIREREIVELMREGLSNKEIAQRLSIEVATVKNHVHNILEKLDIQRRADVGAALRA